MKPPYTPSRNDNIEILIPFLKGKGRSAVRLHPVREENLALDVSKAGGAFIWPKNEEIPTCIRNFPFIPILQMRKEDIPQISFPSINQAIKY